jgi:hypothetical protein
MIKPSAPAALWQQFLLVVANPFLTGSASHAIDVAEPFYSRLIERQKHRLLLVSACIPISKKQTKGEG